MICDNCKGASIETDDVRGEEVCIDCGYVIVSNLIEESQHMYEFTGDNQLTNSNHGFSYVRSADFGILGSRMTQSGGIPIMKGYNRDLIQQLTRTQRRFSQRNERSVTEGYLECNMVLAPYLPNMSLKERTHLLYKKLLLNHHFSLGDTMPLRAVGLVFYVLKEFGIPITMAELCESNNTNPNKSSKMARKIARCLGKPYILHKMSNSHWAERIGADLEASRDYITDVRHVVDKISDLMDSHCIHFSKTYLASCFWLVSRMRCKAGRYPEFTQVSICKCIGCSEVGMRKALAKILQTLGVNGEQLQILSVKEFTAGVIYE